MRYTKKDFSNLQFNPLLEAEMLESYPKLAEIVPAELDSSDLDNIIRYVIMVYDPKSIVVANERDLNYRKDVAAELAGLNKSNEEYIQNIYQCRNKDLLEFAVRYLCRFPRSKEWAAICAFEFKFWESIKKLMQPIKDSGDKAELDAVQKKAAISDEIDKDITRLDNYYKSFFGDEALEKSARRQKISPEMIAGATK